MVKAIININENTNRLLNILKAKYGLKDKSEAIEKMAEEYEEECPRCNTEMRVLYQFSYDDIPEIIKEYLRINKSPPEHECSLITA